MSKMLMLKNVRVSFPHLFEKPVINGDEGKFGATLMLDPKAHVSEIKAINREIKERLKESFKGKKLPSDKLCLRDGADRGREEYEGYMVMSSNNNDKPVVINSSGKGVVTSGDDCPIYGGCYVNAKVKLWAQDNKYGKRVNAQLIAIQFAGEGDPLDGTHVSVNTAMEGFADFDDDDDLDDDDFDD